MKFPLFLTTLNVSRLVIIGSYLLFSYSFSISITISFSIFITVSSFLIFASYLYLLSFTFFFSCFLSFIFLFNHHLFKLIAF